VYAAHPSPVNGANFRDAVSCRPLISRNSPFPANRDGPWPQRSATFRVDSGTTPPCRCSLVLRFASHRRADRDNAGSDRRSEALPPRPKLDQEQEQDRTMSFISYASNFEDVLLNRIFRDVDQGFYIDIGADHPTFSSTTKSFYDRGWSGINVEPSANFALIEKDRLRDINLNAVVTDRDGEIDFFCNDDLLATSSVYENLHPEVASRISQRSHKRVLSYRLDTVIDQYVQDREVHFLKIDAEGSEGTIITSTNWTRFRPIVIVAESTEPFTTKRIDHEWVEHLAGHGYPEAYHDGINTWFVRTESKDLECHFRIPVNLLDNYTVFDYEKILLRTMLEEAAARQSTPPPSKSMFDRIRTLLRR
jgi:FkbM family methyltransferase